MTDEEWEREQAEFIEQHAPWYKSEFTGTGCDLLIDATADPAVFKADHFFECPLLPPGRPTP